MGLVWKGEPDHQVGWWVASDEILFRFDVEFPASLDPLVVDSLVTILPSM